jgi:hypothetical protein
VQVHYDEGVAIHIGPEPCVGVRKDGAGAIGLFDEYETVPLVKLGDRPCCAGTSRDSS